MSAKKKKPTAHDTATVLDHPRAVSHIRAAKGYGGFAGFGLAAYASHKAGVPTDVMLARGVAGGLVLMLAAWLATVVAWRHIAVAQMRGARAGAIARAEEVRRRADEVMRTTASETRA